MEWDSRAVARLPMPAFRPAAVGGVIAGHAVGVQFRAEAHGQRDRLAGQRVARVELVAVLDSLPHGAVVGDLQFIRGIRAENVFFHWRCPVCDEWSKRLRRTMCEQGAYEPLQNNLVITATAIRRGGRESPATQVAG